MKKKSKISTIRMIRGCMLPFVAVLALLNGSPIAAAGFWIAYEIFMRGIEK